MKIARPSRRRHRSGDRRRSGRRARRRCAREGLAVETEHGADRRRAATTPRGIRCPRRRSRSRERPTRCCSARSAARSTTRCRARCGRSRASSAFARRWACSPTLRPALALSRARGRVDAEARRRRRARPHDHPRADRRHLFRRSRAAGAQRRGGRATKASTRCATASARSAASRASASRRRAARQEALLGRQGERARHVASCGARS